MTKLTLSLASSEAKLILEAIAELDSRWSAICQSSEDEEEVADYGNGLTELRLLSERLEHEASAIFGPAVLNFGRDPL